MARIVQIGGATLTLPDNATDQDVQRAIDALNASGHATTPSNTPSNYFDRFDTETPAASQPRQQSTTDPWAAYRIASPQAAQSVSRPPSPQEIWATANNRPWAAYKTPEPGPQSQPGAAKPNSFDIYGPAPQLGAATSPTSQAADPWAAYRVPNNASAPAAQPADPWAAYRVPSAATPSASQSLTPPTDPTIQAAPGTELLPTIDVQANSKPAPAASLIDASDDPVADAAMSFGTGLAKGATNLAMLPENVSKAGHAAVSGLMDKLDPYIRAAFGVAPETPQQAQDRQAAAANADFLGPVQNAVHSAEDTYLHQPQTTLGKVGEFAGEMAVPAGSAAKGVSLARALPQIADKGLAARAALTGLEGAGYGATDAAANNQPIGKGALLGAIFGAGATPVAEGAGKIVSKVAGVANAPVNIPTQADVQAAADAAYKAADNAGVIFTPQATSRLQANVVQNLANMGYDPALQPGAAAVVKRLQDLQGQNVTLTGLDSLRKVASNGFIPGNKSNNKAIYGIMSAIDDAVAKPQSGDVLAGNAAAGSQALNDARDMWSQLAKANAVDQAQEAAQRRASSTGAGQNIDNAMRQKMNQVYENGRGFTPDEETALLNVIKGTPTYNALRVAGMLSPAGNRWLGTPIGAIVGGSIGGPVGATVGAVLPAAGMISKIMANRATARNVADLKNIIMAGGSKAATLAPPNVVQQFAQQHAGDLARGLAAASANRAYGQ